VGFESVAQQLEELSDADLQRLLPKVLLRVMRLSLTKPVTTLELVVTLNCNLRCDYCFVGGKTAGTAMSQDTAAHAIDFLFAHCAHKKDLEVVFFGGEPLLELDLLRGAAAYARARAADSGKSVRFSITTNGTLLDDAAVDFAEEFGILYMLSLDGARATHDTHRRTIDGQGSFDRIARNVPKLKRRQEWLAARMTVSPDTAATLADDVRILFDMGINQFFIEPDFFAEWTKEEISTYQEQYCAVADLYIRLRAGSEPIRIVDFESGLEERRKRYRRQWGCHAGRGRLTVTPDGSLYPCNRFAFLNGGAEQYRLGDLDQDIRQFGMLRDLMDERDIVRPACMGCDMAEYCAGGCPAANLATRGTIYAVPAIYCGHVRALVGVLRDRPDVLKCGWGAESPLKGCCGDEPPCAEQLPLGAPTKEAEAAASVRRQQIST
jgi:uncharacterized protein